MKIAKLLTLVFALALLLTACETNTEPTDPQPNPEASVVGTWQAEWDISKTMDDLLDVDAKLTANVVLTLNEDDTFTFALDRDSLIAASEDYAKALIKAAVDQAYQEAEAEGKSREDFDKEMQEALGMSFEDYMQEQLDSENIFASLFSEDMFEPIKGSYHYQNGKLSIAEEGETLSEQDYIEVVPYDDQLSFRTVQAGDDFAEFLAPMVPIDFTRK